MQPPKKITSPRVQLKVALFRGGHMFFLLAERQQFLNQAGRFLAR